MPPPDPVPTLRALVERAAPALLALPDGGAATPTTAMASPKEVVGRLIDAAALTQQRVEWVWEHDTLVFDDTDETWEGSYAEADWPSLVTLWWMYATRLLRTVEQLPDAVRFRPHARHSLHTLAWQPVAASEPATLDDLMRDFGAHLRHHLARLLPATMADDVPSPHEKR